MASERGAWLVGWLCALLAWVGVPASAAASPPPPFAIEAPPEVYGQPIVEIRFEGNRRVESEAMRMEIESAIGEPVSEAKLARDLRTLWKLGYFEDVKVEGEIENGGVVLTYVVKERPTVRKIVIEGNEKIKLDDLNEVLDLEKNEVLDLGKVKSNVEKLKQLYTEKGYFLADVSYALRPVEDEPGKVDIAIAITESSEVIVRSITFVGNKAFSDEELRKHIQTRVGSYLSLVFKKAGGVYNKEVLQSDHQFLRQFYMSHGYLSMQPKEVERSLSADRRFVHLTIPLDEGPQFRVGQIRAKETLAKGEKALFTEEVLAESIDPMIKVGDVADVGKLEKIREDIERRYKDQGYAHVNVNFNQRLDNEALLLYLTMEIQKGPLVYIERINISGNEKTADKVIRREMLLNEGDLYSETGKEMSEFRVLRLGYFSEATISSSNGSAENKIVLNVEVTERLTGQFQVGAGFSTIENFVLQAQISYDNFLGRGSSVSIIAQVSSLRRLFNFSYFTRYFLDTRWNFLFNVFNSRNIFPSFTRDSTGFRVSWGYPLTKLQQLTLFLGYELERVNVGFGAFGTVGGVFSPGSLVTVPTQALIGNLFINGLTSAITSRLQWDTRDNMLFPTKGQFHQLSTEFASKYFGSDNRYNRYLLDSRIYVPIIRSKQAFRAWLVFKARLTAAYVHSFEPRGVPIFERFFPGGIFGAGGIRGFRLRSLGPRIKVLRSPDATDQLVPYEIGGNLLTALNAEFEFMIVPPANIKGVLFYDMGNAFNTEAQYCTDPNPSLLPKADPCAGWSFRDLRYSMGFGFRWQSPIGPLRFEWGFPLDRQAPTEFIPRGDDPVVFEFNIGNSF